MVREIIVPKLGQMIKEATIDKWLKNEGDKVSKSEVLLEITTDKAALEIESQYDGYLRKILSKEGTRVTVLTVIGFISDSMNEEIPRIAGKSEVSSDSCPLNIKRKKST
ncbi:MAG: lipoyl domain-containing protein [Candidatus Ratteibacteria bacterium]|nr:lipoyl domain-containing protein [Candidatus Ratteibacteria bacterium]